MIPSFKKVDMSVTLLKVLELGYKQQLVKELAGLYLGLGGNPDLKWRGKASIDDVISRLERELIKEVRKRVDLTPVKSSRSVCSHIHIHYEIPYKWELRLELEFPYYTILPVSYLRHLKEDRPDVCKLVNRLLLAIIKAKWSPVRELNSIFEMWFQDTLYEVEEEEFIKDIESEMKMYNEFMGNESTFNKISSMKSLIRSLRAQYGKLKQKLKRDEKVFVESAIEMLAASEKLKHFPECLEKYEDDDGMSWERLPFGNSYSIMWSPQSYLTEQYHYIMDADYGDNAPPALAFPITKGTDFKDISNWISTLCMLAKTMYYGSVFIK